MNKSAKQHSQIEELAFVANKKVVVVVCKGQAGDGRRVPGIEQAHDKPEIERRPHCDRTLGVGGGGGYERKERGECIAQKSNAC